MVFNSAFKGLKKLNFIHAIKKKRLRLMIHITSKTSSIILTHHFNNLGYHKH